MEPTPEPKKEKKPRKLQRYLNETEMASVFQAAGDPRDSVILKTLYYFALRVNELRTLKIEDIDFLKNEIVVMGKGSKELGVPVLKDAEPFFRNELKVYIGDRKSGLLINGDDKDGCISKRMLHKIVRKYAEAAGIRKSKQIHPHTLRHSRATFLYNNGAPIELIQKFLRHARLTTTIDIYTHISTEKTRDGLNAIFRSEYA